MSWNGFAVMRMDYQYRVQKAARERGESEEQIRERVRMTSGSDERHAGDRSFGDAHEREIALRNAAERTHLLFRKPK